MKLIKKIFITLTLIVVLIVGGNILIEGARNTKRFVLSKHYGRMFGMGIEEGKSTESLSQFLLESLKEKSKYNLEATYCHPIIGRIPHSGAQASVDMLWDEVKQEDFSEAQMELVEPLYDDEKNKDIKITNIKTRNDKNTERYFRVQDGEQGGGRDYKCFSEHDREWALEYKREEEKRAEEYKNKQSSLSD